MTRHTKNPFSLAFAVSFFLFLFSAFLTRSDNERVPYNVRDMYSSILVRSAPWSLSAAREIRENDNDREQERARETAAIASMVNAHSSKTNSQ